MFIKFLAQSGGYQKIINLDNGGSSYATKYYKGLLAVENVSTQ